MKNLLQLKNTRTSTKFLLHSLQTYKCLQIKLHNYASCYFGSLHFKKKALSSDCYLNRFVCVLSDFYCLWLFLNARIPDDFKCNSVSRRETGLCSRTWPETHHWVEEATWEMINNIFLIQATGCRAASKNVPTAKVLSTQIFKFGIMCPIICFIAFVNCLC